jgi:hypothetical protein
MSVLPSDLEYFGSADMPEADGATTGGAIDFTKRVVMDGTAISPATQFDVVSSSSSDTAVRCQILYRDATGLLQNPAVATLTGQTKVSLTTIAAERLEAGVVTGGAIAGMLNPGGSTAVGDVAVISHTLVIAAHTMGAASSGATSSQMALAQLQTGDGASVASGMILHTTGGTGPNQIRRILAVNPGGAGADVVAVDRNFATALDATTTYEVGHGFYFPLAGSSQGVALAGTSTQCLACTRMFSTATADVAGGSNRTFYEEFFVNNNNLTTALSSPQVILEALSASEPPGVALNMALATALNDTSTIANRQTAPTGVTAYTSGSPPQSINVPNGSLPASAGAGSATSAQKVVFQLVANAGASAWQSAVTIRTAGSST